MATMEAALQHVINLADEYTATIESTPKKWNEV